MRFSPRLALAAPILALAFSGMAGSALADPEYDQALAASRKMAQGLQSYQMSGTLLMKTLTEGQEPGMQMEAELFSAARWPDLLVSRQKGSMFDLSLGVGPEHSWFYLGQLKTCYLADKVPLNREWTAGQEMELDPQRIYNFYEGLGQTVLPQGLEVGAETTAEVYTIGDRQIPCRVFRTAGNPGEGEGPREYWYDPVSHLVLKAVITVSGDRNGRKMEQQLTFLITGFALNEPVAEDLFSFTPPPGARIVDNLDRLTNPDAMTGQSAPAISFKDLDGTPIKLEDYRGKVVFLDFWATWCGPCKMEMPHIQTLYEEFGASGDVVFLAASSEDKPTINSFIDRFGYTFKVVQVSADEAHGKYKASSIPAGFVIDRQGVIRAHMVGAQTENQLRRALAKAGIGE